MVYSDYGGGSTILPNYTQVVVDMIDERTDLNNGTENITQDNVNGYTIREIEDALMYGRNWNSWKDNILKQNENDTEDNLSILFEHWN